MLNVTIQLIVALDVTKKGVEGAENAVLHIPILSKGKFFSLPWQDGGRRRCSASVVPILEADPSHHVERYKGSVSVWLALKAASALQV